MKTVPALRTIALAIVAASAIACGSDSAVAPGRAPADLGTVLSEMAMPSIATSLVPGLPALPDASIPPSSCTYSSTSQSFACPAVTVGGVTLTRSFTLLNGAGTPQAQFDPATTAGVRMSSTMAGIINSSGNAITLDGHDDFTLAGIIVGVHELNGTSLTHLSGTYAGSTTPFTLTVSTAITNLVLPATAADRWPSSGKVSVDFTGSVEGTPMAEHMTMTYNGTSKVAVSVVTGGLTFNCTVDMASPSPSCS